MAPNQEKAEILDRISYLAARESLVSEDRSRRRDISLLQQASTDELKAEAIIRDIRAEEHVTIWSAEHEHITNTFPGMEFLTGKSLITKSKLFRILKKMPKGGLLHAHLDATVDASRLLSFALEEPAVHVRTDAVLTAGSIGTVLPQFRGLPRDEFTNTESLCTSDYEPGTWVQIKRARATFDPSLGGSEGFDNWVKRSLTIDPIEAYGTHNTVLKIWEKFQDIFSVSFGLTRFQPVIARYIREFFISTIEDGIMYSEPRICFGRSITGPDGKEDFSNEQWVYMFGDVLRGVKEEMVAQGHENDFFGARLIYTVLRNITCEELDWHLDECIKLKQKFPHLVAGFDLVGNENTLRPLIYYIEPLLHFKRRVEELNLDLPFLFHAGETLGDGTEADNNLYDAILLGTKRIGHGYSLVKHPRLMELVRERNIGLEVCPISNEILRLTSSIPAHPLPILLNNGVIVALNSDDPSIFGNMGLSYDFFQVLVSSEITGLMTLATLARQSLEYSTLPADDKAKALAIWERHWAAFVRSIVDMSIISQ